jgi:hypothetical protein
MSKAQVFAPFAKVQELDDGSLYVEGIASTETRDQEVKSLKKYGRGELITADAVRKAIPAYMEWGAVREMHEKIAAGLATSLEVGDDNRTRIAAHIVDDGSIKKVKAGVLKGFSLGGDVTERNAKDPTIIDGLSLTEISLVDRPCNPDARITLVKIAGAEPMEATASVAVETAPVPAPESEQAAPATDPVAKAATTESTQAVQEPAGAHNPSTAGATPAPATNDAPADSLHKGMEAWDAKIALDALMTVQSLIAHESGEDHEEAADQLASLKTAEQALKDFAASEIQEGDEPDAVSMAAETGNLEKGDFPGHPSRGNQHAGGSGEGGSHNKASAKAHAASKKAGKGADSKAHGKAAKAHASAAKAHEKAGNDKAADYHKAMANFHEKAGAKASAKESKAAGKIGHAGVDAATKKDAEIGDLAKRASDAEATAIAAGEALVKVTAERDELCKRLADAEAKAKTQPKPVLRVVEKSQDSGGAPTAPGELDDDQLQKMSPESRAQYEMRKVLRGGMVPLRNP